MLHRPGGPPSAAPLARNNVPPCTLAGRWSRGRADERMLQSRSRTAGEGGVDRFRREAERFRPGVPGADGQVPHRPLAARRAEAGKRRADGPPSAGRTTPTSGEVVPAHAVPRLTAAVLSLRAPGQIPAVIASPLHLDAGRSASLRARHDPRCCGCAADRYGRSRTPRSASRSCRLAIRIGSLAGRHGGGGAPGSLACNRARSLLGRSRPGTNAVTWPSTPCSAIRSLSAALRWSPTPMGWYSRPAPPPTWPPCTVHREVMRPIR